MSRKRHTLEQIIGKLREAEVGLSSDQIPDNITLLPLPPRSPELNPVENV